MTTALADARILVTGGAGFIGSALVRLLLSETGAHVVNLDALTYAGTLSSLPGAVENPRYAFAKADIRDAGALRDVLQAGADLLLVPKQYWMATSSGTTHGSAYLYDQRVPLALMGFGVAPGRYLTSVTPADLAPTFAMLAGITLPHAEGRALSEAIR